MGRVKISKQIDAVNKRNIGGKSVMGVSIRSFYKVIVMKVDVFESEIVDEKHFCSTEEAVRFCDHVMNTSENMTFMVKM